MNKKVAFFKFLTVFCLLIVGWDCFAVKVVQQAPLTQENLARLGAPNQRNLVQFDKQQPFAGDDYSDGKSFDGGESVRSFGSNTSRESTVSTVSLGSNTSSVGSSRSTGLSSSPSTRPVSLSRGSRPGDAYGPTNFAKPLDSLGKKLDPADVALYERNQESLKGFRAREKIRLAEEEKAKNNAVGRQELVTMQSFDNQNVLQSPVGKLDQYVQDRFGGNSPKAVLSNTVGNDTLYTGGFYRDDRSPVGGVQRSLTRDDTYFDRGAARQKASADAFQQKLRDLAEEAEQEASDLAAAKAAREVALKRELAERKASRDLEDAALDAARARGFGLGSFGKQSRNFGD